MLNLMRKKAGSWMIKVLLALIVVVFMFWGVGSFQDRQGAVVAQVDGMPITYDEYNRAYNNMLDRLKQQIGNDVTDEMIQMFQVKEQALDGIVNRRLMLAEANRLGFRISEEELVDTIQSIPAFQREGRFDNDLYQRILNSLRMSPEGFEQDQRETIIIEKLRAFVAGNVKVSDLEARKTYEYQDARVSIDYLLVAPEKYTDITPTSEDLKPFYEERKEGYKTEPKIKVRYVRFIPKDYMDQVDVLEDEIRDYFDTHTEEFKTPKTVEARHILVNVANDADEATVEAARQKILDVLKKARDGEDFAELAKTHSEGPSKERGGLLGAFKKEDMVAPFSEKAFSMAAGDISEPVRTRFGWHLIKVEKINPETSKALAEASEGIKKNLSREKARALAYDAAEIFYDSVFENEDLKQIADEKKQAVQSTDFFDRQGPKEIGAGGTQFATAAFALKETSISEIIDIGDSYYVLQPMEREPAKIPDLAEVEAKVSADWKKMRQDEKAKADAETILGELSQKDGWVDVAKKHGLSSKTTDLFNRSEAIPDIGFERDLSQAAFALTEANPLTEKAVKGQKGYYLIRLKERKAPEPEGFEAKKEEIVQRLQSQKTMNLYNAFLARLKANSKITKNMEFFN